MEITAEQLKEKIENGNKLIVDFYTKWCSPCGIMKPMFEKVSKQLREEKHEVELYTFNVEEDFNLSSQLGIKAVPTIKSFNGGKEIYSKSGIQTESQLRELAKNLING
jgi:thioredoxin 1